MSKKLYRSKTDRVIFGVCGGIAEYFEIDSTIVRVITVALLLVGTGIVWLYIILAIIIPENPSKQKSKNKMKSKDNNLLLGAGLILIGGVTLLNQYNILNWNQLWPIILIMMGVFFIWQNQKK